MPEQVDTLDELIDGYLAGSLPWESLESLYGPRYLYLPEESFADVEAEVWYGVVHERIEWTAPDATEEQRERGWMSVADFRAWLESAVRTRPGTRADP